ncbi:[citrate (pro-3S)-lyase] ligase [Clostridium sp.]|uniref:[citrate (pro-3S)-lyase] ligase n=1 Tax=Clostridium sp. TaxID=1506 RepID=UPI002FC8DA38
MYNLSLEKVNLKNEKNVDEVKNFLKEFNLDLDSDVDYTVVLRSEDKIKATCSKAKSVFKCFAICKDLRGEGVTATLINALNDKLFEQGIYHSFIFTKPENIEFFQGVNYKIVATSEKVALLENGVYNINSYLDKLGDQYYILDKKKRGAIVVNCNPLTLGHLYLIEEASRNCEELLVFVVEENKSLFPFEIRFNLVKEGTKYLKNVKVIKGGEYIISSATFPSYFLRKKDDILEAYTSLDATIFGKYFGNKFNIKKRFVGNEPYCEVTNSYNKALKTVLPGYNIEVCEIERKEEQGLPISASRVREYLKENKIEEVKKIVPKVTYDFLLTEEGQVIREKIKSSNSPH